MDTELLACRRVTVGVVFPPFALEPVQVNKIYAEVTENYPYQNLQHLPDGGRMFNPNGDFFIQTSRLQVNENIDYFHSAKDKAMNLFQIAQQKLNIPEFSNFGVKLIAILPTNEDNASDLLESTLFKNVRESLDIFGGDRKGSGIRIVVHRDAVYEIKIEPLLSDTTQIYIDLDVQYHGQFTDLEIMEPKISAAYEYLFGEVREFIQSL